MEITSVMLEPLTTAISGNMATIVPVGLVIMGLFISVKMIPKVVGWFIK